MLGFEFKLTFIKLDGESNQSFSKSSLHSVYNSMSTANFSSQWFFSIFKIQRIWSCSWRAYQWAETFLLTAANLLLCHKNRSYFSPDLNFERRKCVSPKYTLSFASMAQKHRPTKEHYISQSFGGQTSHRHTTIAAGPTNRTRNNA